MWTLAGASFEPKRNGNWNCKRTLSGVAVAVEVAVGIVIPTRVVDASVPIVSLSGQAKAAMAMTEVTTVANPTAAAVVVDFLVTVGVVAFVVVVAVVVVLRGGDDARFLAHRWIVIVLFHGYGGNCNNIVSRRDWVQRVVRVDVYGIVRKDDDDDRTTALASAHILLLTQY